MMGFFDKFCGQTAFNTLGGKMIKATDYDRIAREFDIYSADAVTDVEIGYAAVIRLLGGCKGRWILDYGCGTGKMSRYLAAHGARVTGVDVSRREIEIAKNRHDGINYRHIKSAGLGMVLPNQDDVVMGFVLCTIPSREEIVRVLKACKDVLRPKGRVVRSSYLSRFHTSLSRNQETL
jgi:2-polyprenyl-3-methyl-5-hydroxy-6-metoxy-1,4-benzoquinol methylase